MLCILLLSASKDLGTRATPLSKVEWREVARVSMKNFRDFMKEKKVKEINNKHLQGLRLAIKDAYGWGGMILLHFKKFSPNI